MEDAGALETSESPSKEIDVRAEVGHVTHLKYEGKDIYLVGTAHVSPKSVEEVERVIEEIRPDSVCVELDAQRLRMLEDDTAWRKLDIFQVIRERRVLFLLSSLALGAYQRKMGEKQGVRPGAELHAGVIAAKRIGAELVLADRDVQATLKRTWANLSLLDRAKITSGLVAAPFSVEEIDAATIEDLKDQDTIGEMMHELAREFPRLKEPLIDERDAYLISSIREATGPKIVGVVGAAHVAGMVRRLAEPVDRAALSVIPPRTLLSRVLVWVIPLIVLGAFYLGYRKSGNAGLEEMLTAWILPHAIGSSLLTLVALGHPLSVVTAFFAAPLTSLNPAVSAGMVVGLVEAYLRKPTVEDCEGLPTAIQSLRGIYGNRATRVLLVFVLSTLGSAIGTWISAPLMAALLR